MQEEDIQTHEKVLGRVLALSDGVFAIAITLLILNVAVPDGTTKQQIPAALAGMWPKYMAFFISFVVIGAFWMSHVRRFRALKRYTWGLLWLNLLVLMFVVIIPFVTNLLSNYNSTLTVILYAITIACAGCAGLLEWLYMYWNNLLSKEVSRKQLKSTIILNLITPVFFILSIGVALIDYNLATYFWILIFVAHVIAFRFFRLEDI